MESPIEILSQGLICCTSIHLYFSKVKQITSNKINNERSNIADAMLVWMLVDSVMHWRQYPPVSHEIRKQVVAVHLGRSSILLARLELRVRCLFWTRPEPRLLNISACPFVRKLTRFPFYASPSFVHFYSLFVSFWNTLRKL